MYSWTPPTKYGTVYYTVKTRGSTSAAVDGTAHVNGTAYAQGTAFARGDWGTKDSGFALGGELGRELVRFLIARIFLFNCWKTLKTDKLQRNSKGQS